MPDRLQQIHDALAAHEGVAEVGQETTRNKARKLLDSHILTRTEIFVAMIDPTYSSDAINEAAAEALRGISVDPSAKLLDPKSTAKEEPAVNKGGLTRARYMTGMNVGARRFTDDLREIEVRGVTTGVIGEDIADIEFGKLIAKRLTVVRFYPDVDLAQRAKNEKGKRAYIDAADLRKSRKDRIRVARSLSDVTTSADIV